MNTQTQQRYGITAPYTIPQIFLPTSTDNFHTRPLPDTMRYKVTRLNNRLREVLNQLQSFLLPLSAVRSQIVLIRAILIEMYEEAYPEYSQLGATYTIETNRLIQDQHLPDYDRHHLGGYIVYDEYFDIVRVPELTPVQLLGQCVSTMYAMLGDLPYTMLAREEIIVLFTALYKLFNCFFDTEIDDVPPVPANYVMQENNNLEATALLWTTLATDNVQRKSIAMFRWLVGHHTFNMITIFLTEAVNNAIKAIEAGNNPTIIAELDRASTFLRAGIACEWYAANFSSGVYTDIVRPTMIRQDIPGGDGFSGDQNAEFNRFKVSKENLKRAVRTAYDEDGLPPNVEGALRQFVEMYVQDAEHHVLLAAAMVGSTPSIAQDEWQKDLPSGTPAQSAVDFLRDMVSARREEFSKPVTKSAEPILQPVKQYPLPTPDAIPVASEADFAKTNLIRRDIGEQAYLIGKTDGQYWAVSARCTHKDFPISDVLDEKGCLVCTKHGAQFDTITGERLRGPVGTTDLPRYDVVLDDGTLLIKGINQT